MSNVDLDGGGDDIREFVGWTHGGAVLQEKVARWREIRSARIWLIDEYNDSIETILQAYTHGLFFPAMTGACSLAEHVMNRLIIKLRDYFRRSKHYRKIYDRHEKIQNWTLLIRVLWDWHVFNKDQVGVAKQLRTLRNDSVHYVPGYDFEAGSTEAVTLLMALLDSLFSALNRTDLFRVFEIPGEIWVRADRENDPFVKEFVLSCCTRMAAVSRLDDTGYSEDGARVGEMTETDFIHLRREYQRAEDQFHDGRTPRVIEHTTNGAIRKFVIP